MAGVFLNSDNENQSMDKRYLKWSILAPVILMTLAIIGAVIFLVAPLVFSTILGVPRPPSSDICNFSGPSGGLKDALGGLCDATQVYLGAIVMILIVLAGATAAIMWIVAAIDVLTLPSIEALERLLWLVIVVFMPFVGPAVYYVVKRRGRK